MKFKYNINRIIHKLYSEQCWNYCYYIEEINKGGNDNEFF